MKKIDLSAKFDLFEDLWSPKIIASSNGQLIKLAKVQGAFVWHSHAHEDELFYVQKGTLYIEFRDHTEVLGPGEMLVVPAGVEHRPYTLNNEQVELILIEPDSTKHTGKVQSELTQESPEYI